MILDLRSQSYQVYSLKVKFYIFTILFIFLYNINLEADEILFDSGNLKIQNNGNTIYGKEVIAKIPSKKIEIEGDKSIYDKINSKLTKKFKKNSIILLFFELSMDKS